MLVDSHCHLDFPEFEEDFDEVIEKAKRNGVNTILNAGSSIKELESQLKISEKYPFIYTAVGVHPNGLEGYENITSNEIIEKTKHKKVVAIGECGLDYYYETSTRDLQEKVFIEHIKAAQETGLPIIIHNRDSDEDMIRILDQQYNIKPFLAQLHCFSSSRALAEFAVSKGFYLSASGIITFNQSHELREIFEDVPMENLLVETDAPFLAPVPKRGRRNQPAYVKYTAEKLAQIKEVSLEEIAEITTENFFTLFRKASDKGRYEF